MHSFSASFALLLYDEFNGALINDPNVIFRHEGRIMTPLRKREGFYVFRGLDLPEVELEINRPHYMKKRKYINKTCLDPGSPVEQVRLMRAYPGTFSDCEWLHGCCRPDSEVLAFVEDEQIKLQTGDDEKNRLTILGCAAGSLIGRRFARDMTSGETFLLTRMLAPGVYLSDKEVPAPPKAGCPVFRAYLSKSGLDSRYHIPVERGQSQRISGTMYYDRGEGKWVYASATERS